MTNQSLPVRALWNALGATAYIALMAAIFHFKLFGEPDGGVIAQMTALLMVVFSVLLMGTLLLVPPLRLYLDGQKIEGVRLLMFAGMWMGAFMFLFLTAAAML